MITNSMHYLRQRRDRSCIFAAAAVRLAGAGKLRLLSEIAQRTV